MNYLPKDINTNIDFYIGSSLKKAEHEIVLCNIVKMLKKINNKEWTAFSWDDYLAFCTHTVTYKEKCVLEELVDAKWINTEHGKYYLAQKTITMLGENYPSIK